MNSPHPLQTPSNSCDHKPSTNDDACIQVRFDPQFQESHRRKESLSGTLSTSSGGSSAFLHKILGNWNNIQDKKETGAVEDEHEDVHAGYLKSMTRSQLHDMVFGLREMGRKYANVHLHMKVREVFIVTKPWDTSLAGHTKQLAKWLLEKGYNVYVEDTFRENAQFDAEALMAEVVMQDGKEVGKLRYWTQEMCTDKPGGFDFVLTLGGDGTVLYTSWLFQNVVPPVLSFSLGSLGFLTKFDFSDHAGTLSRMFGEDGVTVGLRVRFEGTIMRAIPRGEGEERETQRSLREELLERDQPVTHRPDCSTVVLNEIVVDRGPSATMTTAELYANDEFLTSIAADGLCVATPTGSTAYSLAAGGSLCHPALPGMLITVICAHSLTFRPILLPDNIVLRIGVPYDARTSSWVSFDGRRRTELNQGDYITIVASQYPLPTVQYRMDNKDWFDSIKRTMNWGDRITQKSIV